MKNEIKYVSWSNEEKAKMFDEIAEKFYYANFGQLSKTDMELMMFHFYIEKMIEQNKSPNGTIDYNKCSDYLISKELGVTQQRVRNLKVKKQLIYPTDYDWKLAFSTIIKNATYDSDTHKILMNIPDPNLYYEIQNFFDERGNCIDHQLNSKILQMREEYFLALAIEIEEEKNRNQIIKELKKQFKELNKDAKKFDERNIGKNILNLGESGLSIVANIINIFSPGNFVCSFFKKIIL